MAKSQFKPNAPRRGVRRVTGRNKPYDGLGKNGRFKQNIKPLDEDEEPMKDDSSEG